MERDKKGAVTFGKTEKVRKINKKVSNKVKTVNETKKWLKSCGFLHC
jgi:hypothetical protein